MKHFNLYDLLPFLKHWNEEIKGTGLTENILGGQGDIWHSVSATLIMILLMLISFAVASSYSKGSSVVPEKGVSLKNIFEFMVESLYNMVEGVMGEKQAQRHFPILGATFIYIFFNNFLGLLPGFPPATSTLANNVAPAVVIFLYYNYMGLREHGIGYIKHFMGPVIWLAWLMLPIELIGHLVRPLSLSLRLAGNMTGDHMVLGIFTDLTYIGVPVIFLGLGSFVCFIQAYVFTLLSTIYVSMAVAHDH